MEPLLQLRALKTPTFAYSAVIVTVVNSALAVGSVILPIYLQNVLGLTAFETGILMTPGAVATIWKRPSDCQANRPALACSCPSANTPHT